MKKININLELTKKQIETIEILKDKTTTEILYGGGVGSGKSFIGCVWIITSALKYPGTRWLIGRKSITTLKLTTMKTFFEVCDALQLKIEESYKYNQASNTITFSNGSEVILKDLDIYPSDPNFDSLGSLEITGAFIDEVAQITKRAKDMVGSRIRFKLDIYDLIPKLFMSCNPTKGWLYEEFYKRWKESKLPSHAKFIPALVTDNPFVSKHYIKQLSNLDEQSKQRLLFGNWEYASENNLFKFDFLLDAFQEVKDSGSEKFMSLDIARKNDKTVVFVWDKLNVIDLFYCDNTNFNTQIDKIKELKEKYKVSDKNCIVDSDGIGSPITDIINAVEFHNNGKPFNDENYNNIKSQLYFKLSECFNENKIKISSNLFDIDEQMKIISEIECHRQEDIDKDGKVKITPKDKVKQILGRSPDFADALMMRMWFEFKPTLKLTEMYDFAF